tara:strand:- start:57378 stop:58304 length:927 start_codon:yes stop_codon:yes gene_type:complete
MKEKIQILKEIFGHYYKSKSEYLFKCPFCAHHKRKLSINLHLNVFKCWVCDSKGKNIRSLIKRFGSEPLLRQWDVLTGTVDMSNAAITSLFTNESKAETPRLKLPEEFISLANKNLPLEAHSALRYLGKRRINIQQVRYFRMGFCHEGEYRNRIIIPSFNEEGYCNYFVARSYIGSKLKYKNPAATRDLIFNDLLINWERPVILVEGIFDAINAPNSIPILGSTLNTKSELFAKLIDKQPKVYIALDYDVEEKSLLLIKNMIEYGLEVYKMDTSKISDIGDSTKVEIETLQSEALLMDFDNIIKISCR